MKLWRQSLQKNCLAAFILLVFVACEPSGDLEKLPDIDLSGQEKQVAAKIEGLLAAVRAQPGDGDLWGKLGINLYVHDWRKESVPCFAEAAKLTQEDARWPYYAGVALFNLSDSAATTYYQMALDREPANALFRLRLANALKQRGELETAESHYHEILNLDDKHSNALSGLASIHLLRDNYPLAIEYAEKALASDSRNRDAVAVLANSARKLQNQEMLELYSSRLQSLPAKNNISDPYVSDMIVEGVSSRWYRVRGNEYLSSGYTDRAISELSKVLEIREDAVAHNDLGSAYLKGGKLAEAVTHFRKAIDLQPQKSEFLNNLGIALCQQGDMDTGLSYIQKATALSPDNTDITLSYARNLMKAGQWKQARNAYEAGLSRNSDNPYLAFNMAWLLATAPDRRVRDGRKALSIATKIADASRHRNPRILDVLAASHAEQGDYQQAVAVIGKALELAGESGDENLSSLLTSRQQQYEKKRPWRLKMEAN